MLLSTVMDFFSIRTHRFPRLLLASLLGIGAWVVAQPQSAVQAAPSPMFAFTSAHSGHWSYKLSPTSQSVVASIGDMSTNTNWRCSWNTNIANNAGTKIYQGRSCDAVVTEIDVATNATRTLAINMKSNSMAISPDDRYLYTGEPYYINKWDLSTTPPTNVGGGSRNDNNAGISLAILPNGSKLYSPCIQAGKNQVQVFNSNLALVATITNPAMTSPSWALANPNGNEVWIGAGSSFFIVDPATDTIVRTYTNTYGTTSFPSFNSTGTRLWISTGNGLQEINTATGETVRTITGTGMNGGSHASLSPDGEYLYVAAGQTMAWAKTSDGSHGTFSLPTQTPNNDTPRTVVWAQAVQAPSISLDTTAATLTVGVSATGLYTINNSGGQPTSYSISPSLPSGLTFSSSTGLISGTPTGTAATTTYTITATNIAGSSSATFTLSAAQPTTTTTSTTTSTTITPTSEGLVTSSQNGTTGSSSTSNSNTLKATTNSYLPTATTLQIRNSAISTTTTIPAPDAPVVSLGEAASTVDGKDVVTKLTRSNNSLEISAGSMAATIYGENSDGARIDLDENGDLNLMGGDTVIVEATGFKAASAVDVWMFSTPTHLGVVKSSNSGKINGAFTVDYSIKPGNHRFVLAGKSMTNADAVLGVGIHVGAMSNDSGVNKWLIIFPIILAVSLGLILPTTLRRRRKEDEATA